MLAFLLAISDERHHKTVSHIFKSYHSDMPKLARYKLRGQENFKELAEDAVENALLKITKYVNKLCADDIRSMRAYVMNITANECANIINSEKDVFPLPDGFPDESFTEESFIRALSIKERYDTVVKGITILDDKYRIPMYMKYVEELSPEEISEMLELPIKTVYTRLRRGKAMLLEYAQKEGIYV